MGFRPCIRISCRQIACAWPEFVDDIDAPCCFACRWNNGATRWSESRLQRCHIISCALGGAESVENLVLLCSRCHLEAPMTNRREVMLDWMHNREFYGSWLLKGIMREAEQFLITSEEWSAAGEITTEDLMEKAHEVQLQVHPSGKGDAFIAPRWL